MSNLKPTCFIAIACFALSVSYSPPSYAAADRLAASICEAAKTNNRSQMRKKLSKARLRLRDIYQGLRCGKEGSLLRVATNANAMDSAKYILSKAKKVALSKKDKDGDNIIQYTQKLVDAGDASKQEFLTFYQSK
jgi:hypothetical protein